MMRPVTEPSRAAKLAVVGGGLAVIAALHVVSDPMDHNVHNVLFKVTYVPLILAGWWFHLRGGLAASGLMSVFALAHYFTQLSPHAEHGGHPLWSVAVDVGLYNVVAFTTGALAQRRDHALAQAEAQTRELERNARALLQAEEAMRRSERLRALGELAAGMAHEIRNPLGGIRGAAEVLTKPGTRPEARAEFGKLLDEEIARLDRVVGNFLDFARPSPAEIASVRPAEVVDAVFLLLSGAARRAGVVTENAVPRDAEVRADADLLRQVLLNLCLNAVQAQPSGGRVRVAAARDGGRVRIDVEDAGRGVAPDLRERLFDAYVSGRAGGSGLGLPIAGRLAATMGGSVELVRTGEGGSVFRVTLAAA
jgi:two-component system, NtrC family, sensor histidine kinase HydH